MRNRQREQAQMPPARSMTGESNAHFADVTELAGQKISAEQLERICNRYYWARSFVENLDILEIGCGAGQGLGYLATHARSVAAGDISAEFVNYAKNLHGDTIDFKVFDATTIPWPDLYFDSLLLFEVIYYLPNVDAFFEEARRVLKPGGHLLIATANKDLYDFNPSPYSVCYYGVRELEELCSTHGFESEFWGFVDLTEVSIRQRILRPVKSIASRLGLVPKTMSGKELLKRFFFGTMTKMPASILDAPTNYVEPTPLPGGRPDNRHKVIYCAARLTGPAMG